MKTDFDKFRKWHHYQVASAVVMLTLAIADIIVSAFSGFSHISNRFGVVGLVLVATSFKIFSYSRCPHCGKSVMSKWLGRDSAGRNCTRRIEKHLPILCFHCGQEVETT